MNQQPQPGYRSIKLWIILLTPLIVIISSTLLYYSGLLAPEGRTNNGELIYPPIDITDIEVDKDDGNWWLLTVAPDGCGQACEEQLFWVQQVHIALGRESPRVRRKLITDGSAASDLEESFQGLEARQGVTAALPMDETVQLFIADPLGNIMMKFGPDNEYEDVLDDLKTLLSRSTIG